MLEPSVDRLCWSVAGARPVEVGQHVDSALLQCSAEPGDLDQRLRNSCAEVIDQLGHQLLPDRAVRLAVGLDHPLVDAPGGLDLDVGVVDEQGVESVDLTVGEQPRPGVQGAAGLVEFAVAAVAVDRELHAAAALV